MILSIVNSKDSTKSLRELINEFGKVAQYKINIQKSFAFYTPIMNYQKGKLRKQSHLHLHQKNKIPRNKINQGGKRPVLKEFEDIEEKIVDTYKWKHILRSWIKELTS